MFIGPIGLSRVCPQAILINCHYFIYIYTVYYFRERPLLTIIILLLVVIRIYPIYRCIAILVFRYTSVQTQGPG